MAGSKKNLKFEYDAFGRRIAKHVYNNETAMLEKSTYYILDAQGNQLSMYEHFVEDNTAKFYLAERNIYGSSRLGTTNDTINMFIPEILPSYGIMGNRTYELSNHLGNVLTTISDIKYPISSDNTTIDGYEVGMSGISDYSPFGAPLDGRTVGRLGKYGFNSQERDDEVSGEGNSYTAEFWQYSPRLGRRWNIDPVIKEYESPYAAFANNPIWFIDPNGADTSFSDNQVRNDFMNAYNKVKSTINSLTEDIKLNKDLLTKGGLSNSQIKSTNKNIEKMENSLNDWNKLGEDFNEIISSPVKYMYSSNSQLLDVEKKTSSVVNGLLSDESYLKRNENFEVISGEVHIYIRAGHDEAVIHENRHGVQILSPLRHSKFALEKDAYLYQQIYNYGSVEKFIIGARDLIQWSIDKSERTAISLDRALNTFIMKNNRLKTY